MGAPEGNRFWEQRTKHGANPKYDNAETLWRDCVGYFEWNAANPWLKTDFKGKDCEKVEIPIERPLTLGALCIYLGIVQDTWIDWRSSRKDLSEVIARVEEIVRTQKVEGAAVGAFNASIIARDLGLADKVQHDVSDELADRMARAEARLKEREQQ